ncbi:MAG: CDP-alcohol phosphatidyltransferase family protein [Rhodospirillales bacterium]|nr:CDP-alcohol phosphatidyltransferase family protein [Rhodospirillales bacterium]
MKKPPWDQQIARVLVRPLAASPIRPNHISALTLLLALFAAALFAGGDPVAAHWGAGIFILSRFLDHFDGELARQQGTTSRLGYYLDYVSGGISYAALFIGLGLGFMGAFGVWAVILGGAGALSALVSLFSNLAIDQQLFDGKGGEAVGYPGFAGFELEDGIYLLGPITWIGLLSPFFIAAGIGASIYCLWSLFTYVKLAAQNK